MRYLVESEISGFQNGLDPFRNFHTRWRFRLQAHRSDPRSAFRGYVAGAGSRSPSTFASTKPGVGTLPPSRGPPEIPVCRNKFYLPRRRERSHKEVLDGLVSDHAYCM